MTCWVEAGQIGEAQRDRDAIVRLGADGQLALAEADRALARQSGTAEADEAQQQKAVQKAKAVREQARPDAAPAPAESAPVREK